MMLPETQPPVYRALSEEWARIPALADYLAHRKQAQIILREVRSWLPPSAVKQCIDCIFCGKRVIIVVSGGGWDYFLRLRTRQLSRRIEQMVGRQVKLVIHNHPDTPGPVPPPAPPLPGPGRETIDSMLHTADCLQHDGLRQALRQLGRTLGSRLSVQQ